MAWIKVTHICKYEVGYRPHSHWETKEFKTHGEAEMFADEWRRNHSGGAYADEIVERGEPTADDIRAANTVSRCVDRMFRNAPSSGRLF